MSVSLVKGDKVNLSKEVEKLTKVTVGLGWDMANRGSNIDCDSSVFVLTTEKPVEKKSFLGIFKKAVESGDENAVLRSGADIIYYGHLEHSNGCIKHRGDNLVGGSGKRNDDEQIAINLKNMPEDVKKLVVVVNIYSCRSRSQHFGMIKNCYARIVDDGTQKEICKFNLTDDYSGSTALVLGELYRNGEEWEFKAVGKGTKDTDIESLSKRYK